MTELFYRSKGAMAIAWAEIAAGRDVALIVTGWRRGAVYRVISSYIRYLELSRTARAPFILATKIAWQSLFAPSIVGLCEHARQFGLKVSASGEGDALKVKFEKQ